MAVDILKFKQELGSVIKMDSSQIWKQMLTRTVTLKYCRTVSGYQDGQIYVSKAARIGEVSQAFQSKWTPKGTATFTPAKIVQRRHKFNFEFTPDDFVGDWLGNMTDEANKNKANWPISRYLLQELLLPKIVEEREEKKVFKGKHEGISTGVAGAAVSSVDGFGTIINNNIGVTINGISGIGILEEGSTYEQINAAAKQLPEGVKQSSNYLAFVSEEFLTDYLEGWEEANGTLVRILQEDKYIIKGTKIRLVGLPSMAGSGRFFFTKKKNMIRLIDKVTPEGLPVNFNINKYVVEFWGDWHESFGFDCHEEVYANYISGTGFDGSGDEVEVFIIPQ